MSDGDIGDTGGTGDAAAPESYEAFTLPEGRALSDSALEGLTPLFKEAKLTQENAQKFVELHDTLTQSQIAEATAKNVAPEKYEDFTLPEGRQVDQKALEIAVPIFKELGLSQEQAQQLIAVQDQVIQGYETATDTTIKEQNDAWKAAAEKDPDIDVAVAQKALGTLGDAETAAYLKDSGIGNHPGVLKIFTKIGKLLEEDNNLNLGGTGDPKGDLTSIYNHPTSKVNSA